LAAVYIIDDFTFTQTFTAVLMLKMRLSHRCRLPFNRHIVSGVNFCARREDSTSIVDDMVVMCTNRESPFTTRDVPQHSLIAHRRRD
jgi:hypothetical protein